MGFFRSGRLFFAGIAAAAVWFLPSAEAPAGPLTRSIARDGKLHVTRIDYPPGFSVVYEYDSSGQVEWKTYFGLRKLGLEKGYQASVRSTQGKKRDAWRRAVLRETLKRTSVPLLRTVLDDFFTQATLDPIQAARKYYVLMYQLWADAYEKNRPKLFPPGAAPNAPPADSTIQRIGDIDPNARTWNTEDVKNAARRFLEAARNEFRTLLRHEQEGNVKKYQEFPVSYDPAVSDAIKLISTCNGRLAEILRNMKQHGQFRWATLELARQEWNLSEAPESFVPMYTSFSYLTPSAPPIVFTPQFPDTNDWNRYLARLTRGDSEEHVRTHYGEDRSDVLNEIYGGKGRLYRAASLAHEFGHVLSRTPVAQRGLMDDKVKEDLVDLQLASETRKIEETKTGYDDDLVLEIEKKILDLATARDEQAVTFYSWDQLAGCL
ncbi:MAG: hypothetical protein V1798_12280 [Pseudomonadota bacterium]